jgi:hypothetical protein
MPLGLVARLWALAAGAAVIGRLTLEGMNRWIEFSRPSVEFVLEAIAVLGVYGLVYLAGAAAMRIPEAQALTRRLIRR